MIEPSLYVLPPIALTDAMFVSSTVPETDYAAYAAGTTYAVGTRCISAVTHRIYESLRASNTGNDPTAIVNRAGTAPWWLEVGPTNRWAMFDSVVSTQTTVASPLTVVLRPGQFNAVYLGGLDADQLALTVRDAPGGAVIYDATLVLEGSAPADYYEHFFDRFKPQRDYLASGLDAYYTAEITLTLTKASGSVKCGILALGDLKPLGATMYGAKAKPKTYSYIDIDDFGSLTIKRRKATTDVSLSAMLKLDEANTTLETIQSVLDVPCAWIGNDLPEYGGLRVFGLGSGELTYDLPKDCKLSLTIQGLI
ncbi:MAG: hypothetical protein KA223_06500 [Candidatus Accumulibacter sp.]|nr:hypothetical protein [Accumulibacter sp.]